jgi:hypothetical protein
MIHFRVVVPQRVVWEVGVHRGVHLRIMATERRSLLDALELVLSGAWKFYMIFPARARCGGVRRVSDWWPWVYHWLRHYGINTEALIPGKTSRESWYSWRKVNMIKRPQALMVFRLCGQRER